MVGDARSRSAAQETLGVFELTRPAEPETVTAFRHHASAFAVEQGGGPDLVEDVALAVSEAVTNAVKYAYGDVAERTVSLSASVEDGWLTLRVGDRGTSFRAGPSDGLGLGLSIIARLCDDLKIVQEGSGTQVLMRFVFG
jgi:serine/threonine-protein kinase RsbW